MTYFKSYGLEHLCIHGYSKIREEHNLQTISDLKKIALK